MERIEITVPVEYAGKRADAALSGLLAMEYPESSSLFTRSYVQKLIDDGLVTSQEKKLKKSDKMSAQAVILVDLPDPEPIDAQPEDIPLDIVYEDDDLIVVNKPKGMVVHPAADNDAEIIVEYNIEAELEYMARYCTEPVENIKAQIADFLEDVNDFIDSITGFTFQNVGDKFISGLNEYMQKITQNLWRFLHPNSLMQPTMLLKNTETGKYAIMSRSGKVPSKMNKTNFLIIPTTYTAELLSPAYKKFVAVTNVFKDGVSAQDGDADCKSVLDKANAQSRINEVIEGGFDEFIRFEGQNGYIYEFLYTAVDYSGKVFANKYYVKVSE